MRQAGESQLAALNWLSAEVAAGRGDNGEEVMIVSVEPPQVRQLDLHDFIRVNAAVRVIQEWLIVKDYDQRLLDREYVFPYPVLS